MYWLLYKISASGVNRKELDELPKGYLNVTILIFTILFIHIARPIKSENINPEQPHWMMNLDNWYEKNAVRKFFGAENEAEKTIDGYIKYDLTELTKEVNNSNALLKKINGNLE